MKILLFVCLMAASQPLFAQNIDLADFESLLSRSSDSVDEFLSTKGFQKVKIQGGAPVQGLQIKEGWSYRSDPSTESKSVTILGRFIDTSGKTFYKLQTTNSFFYSHLMNQFAQNNYRYTATIPTDKEANLVFRNNKYEIVVRISPEIQVQKYYQINIGEAISDIGFFLPRKTNVKRVTVKPNPTKHKNKHN